MKRERLFSVLEREWTGLMESFSGLPDSVLVEPGVVVEWSVRDLLGHIATLEEEAMAALREALAVVEPAEADHHITLVQRNLQRAERLLAERR